MADFFGLRKSSGDSRYYGTGDPRRKPFEWFGRSLWRKLLFVVLVSVLVLGTLHVSFRFALDRVRTTHRELRIAAAYLGNGRFQKALDHYNAALELDERKQEALSGRGICLLYLGRYSDALASYERLIAVDHDNIYGWQGKAMTLDKLGRYDEALRAFDHVLEIEPGFRAVRRQRQQLMRKMNGE